MSGFKMRRVLDLNQAGAILVKAISFFGLLAPGALYGVAWLAGEGSVLGALLWRAIRSSVTIGALLLAVLVALVVVEQVQDYLFEAKYQKQRGRKVPLGDGYQECQYCGNRQVRAADKQCGICGKEQGRESRG